jgi:transposase
LRVGLKFENIKASRVGIAKFLRKVEETGSIGRRPGSGRPSKVTAEIKQLVESQIRLDDETTAYQLHAFLVREGYNISR